MEKSKKYIYKKQNWIDKIGISDQEGSGPPWAVMPSEEEEEHNIVTRQWKMSVRNTYAWAH